MTWALLILAAASAVAGLALGPVIDHRSRRMILLGGVEAALLGGALAWLPQLGVPLPVDPGTRILLAVGLLAVAALLLPLWVGASWSGH